MPGIVGIITDGPRQWAETQLAKMVSAIRHESFYTTGTHIDETLGVYVGWAVQKNSFSDANPIVNEKGDVALIFSGDEYAEPCTAERLKARGHSFDADGPSYLVHQYEEAKRFPQCLNGMFHGIVVDGRQGRALLFNDRFGMHRIYYHESNNAFYFAAEAKAILAAREELRELDQQGLGEFVALSCVLEDRTLFKRIRALPAASAWEFCSGRVVSRKAYFHPREWEQQPALPPETYYGELRDILSRNLPRYFAGRQRKAIALTGGLDTRVIMAWQKRPSGTLPCYTFGGMFRDCRDVQLARKVARICAQPHEVIRVDRDFLAQFPHYAERSVYLTEGGVDVYRASDLYVSEKARGIAPVKIVGTYGSEILQQAVMFKPAITPPGLFGPELLSHVQQARHTYAKIRKEHPVTFAAFRQSPWYHHGILSLEQTQITVRSPYLDNDFVRTVYRSPKSPDGQPDLRLRLIAEGSTPLSRLWSDRGVAVQPGVASIVTRGFQEFTFKAEYAYDYGMPQWVSRVDHALASLRLERLFLGRHKFSHYRVWYRDSLSDYVRQILLDSRSLSRPYLKRGAVEGIVEGHTKGGRNYTSEIHKLITMELIHRLFLDSR